MSEQNAIEIIARHVGAGDDDWGFLPCLRRGEAVPMGKVAELTKALGQLEDELQGSPVIDRRAAHAPASPGARVASLADRRLAGRV